MHIPTRVWRGLIKLERGEIPYIYIMNLQISIEFDIIWGGFFFFCIISRIIHKPKMEITKIDGF